MSSLQPVAEGNVCMSRQVTLRGNPLALDGPELKVGDKAPDATVASNLGVENKLSEYAGKKRVYSVVPSLDTPVCAQQTKRFNEEAGKIDGVEFYTISMDLPTAQGRFCSAEGIDKDRLHTLSDHKYGEFGKNFGTLIPALRILSRAVFVVGEDDTIKHVEYVPEVAEEPNYDAVLDAIKGL